MNCDELLPKGVFSILKDKDMHLSISLLYSKIPESHILTLIHDEIDFSFSPGGSAHPLAHINLRDISLLIFVQNSCPVTLPPSGPMDLV